MANIAVIGTGYVGLVTATCFAHLGHDVVALDIDADKIAKLNKGEPTIHEDGLEDLLSSTSKSKKISFTTNLKSALEAAEFVFLCVPTPSADDGSVDLKYLQAASQEVAELIKPGTVVVNKSTVPVGSTRVVENILQRDDVAVVSNPEFLREGTAIHDFLNPDRVVIGSDDVAARGRVAELYSGLNTEVVQTDPASAETIKYGANAYLATKISFVNALANLCEEIGANVNDVVRGIGLDNRIGMNSMKPGPGWGGSCFPKDTRALLSIGRDVGYDFALLDGVIEVNEYQRDRIVEKTKRAVGGTLLGRHIGVLGLTFKAGTDDLRESPAIDIVNRLAERGAELSAYDPTNPTNADNVKLCTDPYIVAERAEALVVLTEWPEFGQLDLTKIKSAMKHPRIIDARNIIDADAARAAGFEYVGIGGV